MTPVGGGITPAQEADHSRESRGGRGSVNQEVCLA